MFWPPRGNSLPPVCHTGKKVRVQRWKIPFSKPPTANLNGICPEEPPAAWPPLGSPGRHCKHAAGRAEPSRCGLHLLLAGSAARQERQGRAGGEARGEGRLLLPPQLSSPPRLPSPSSLVSPRRGLLATASLLRSRSCDPNVTGQEKPPPPPR